MEPPSPSLSKKVAWVTGASSGIGAATAQRLTDDGWTVAMTARSEEKLIARALKNPHLIPYPGDITDEAAMAAMIAQIESEQGPIQLVILNAGVGFPDKTDALSLDNFRQTFDVNLYGTIKCLKAVLPNIIERGKGHIAIVASMAGYRGLPESISYGPSKAALQNMTEALAIDLGDKGIKVQLINPGFVKTAMTDNNKGPMPMLMPVDQAANHIVKGLSSRRFEIAFPLAMKFLLKTAGLLPPRAYFWLARRLRNSQH